MITLSIDLLHAVAALAKEVGQCIMPIYERPLAAIDTEIKQDGSPLTEADLLAHQLLIKGLQRLAPELPCLSEESASIAYHERAQWSAYWLIDPIDGTKEFLAQNGDFTVNIALIVDQQPVLGVVYAPVDQHSYFAARDLGAFKQIADEPSVRLAVKPFAGVLKLAASRRHGAAVFPELLQRFPDYSLVARGSSLKFCLIAEGAIDIYPRLALTSEWDTAAAQCVLEQAGGGVTDLSGQPLRYNTRDSVLNPFFVAFADASIPWWQYLNS